MDDLIKRLTKRAEEIKFDAEKKDTPTEFAKVIGYYMAIIDVQNYQKEKR